MKKPYVLQAKGPKQAELLIYEDIGEGWFGGLSAKQFAEDLKALGALDLLDVRINSYGGAIFDGFAMYSTLARHAARKTVHVDGVAASAASVIAMAGDEIRVASNGFVMIHNPWGFAQGNADELRKQAELLDQIRGAIAGVYVARTGLGVDEVLGLMDAETWMDSAEAVRLGFADSVTGEMKMAARAEPGRFRHAPSALTDAPPVSPAAPLATRLRQRLAENVLRTQKRS